MGKILSKIFLGSVSSSAVSVNLDRGLIRPLVHTGAAHVRSHRCYMSVAFSQAHFGAGAAAFDAYAVVAVVVGAVHHRLSPLPSLPSLLPPHALLPLMKPPNASLSVRSQIEDRTLTRRQNPPIPPNRPSRILRPCCGIRL